MQALYRSLPGWTFEAFHACPPLDPALRCVLKRRAQRIMHAGYGHHHDAPGRMVLLRSAFYTRRVTPRTEASEDVYAFWYCNGRGNLSRVRNLNLGGIFVEAPIPKDLGAPVELYLLVPEGQIHAKAVVRHMEPNEGLGLKIMAFREKDRLRFGALMKRLYSAQCAGKHEGREGVKERVANRETVEIEL